MRRVLPCPKCGTAKIKDGDGKLTPYEMGVAPSSFRTPGALFDYVCQGCARPAQREGMTIKNAGSGRHSISKAAFYALPDLDTMVGATGIEPA